MGELVGSLDVRGGGHKGKPRNLLLNSSNVGIGVSAGGKTGI